MSYVCFLFERSQRGVGLGLHDIYEEVRYLFRCPRW